MFFSAHGEIKKGDGKSSMSVAQSGWSVPGGTQTGPPIRYYRLEEGWCKLLGSLGGLYFKTLPNLLRTAALES